MARTPVFIEVKDSSGNVVPAASINIKKRSNGADATLYNAEVAGSVIANPTIADSLGRVSVWVDRGDYNAFVTGTGITAYTVPIDAGPTGDAEIDITWLPASVQSLVVGGNTVTRQTGGTMPASPVDGDRVIYTADATNGITWEFLYRSAAASPYKWEFIGGGDMYSEQNVTGGTVTSGTYAAIPTNPVPTLTLPLAGDYMFSGHGVVLATTVSSAPSGLIALKIGAAAVSDGDSFLQFNEAVNAAGNAVGFTIGRSLRRPVTAAGTVIDVHARTTGSTWASSKFVLTVRPMRVA